MKDLHPHKPEIHNTPTGHYGHIGHEKVRDTHGMDIIKTYGGDDFVVLKGNSVQPRHGGDMVHLGHGNDTIKIHKSQKRNHIHAEEGHDRVKCGGGDISADLGSGNDIYHHIGGYDFLTMGEGSDILDLTKKISSNKSSIVVHDFDLSEDRITGLSNSAKLVWRKKIHGFTVKNQPNTSVKLFTTDSDHEFKPDYWVGIGLQNPELYNLKKDAEIAYEWKRFKKDFSHDIFKLANFDALTWSEFKNNKSNFMTAAADFYDQFFNSKQYRNVSSVIPDLVDDSEGYHQLVAGLINLANSNI